MPLPNYTAINCQAFSLRRITIVAFVAATKDFRSGTFFGLLAIC
jgi:hypothetical protein